MLNQLLRNKKCLMTAAVALAAIVMPQRSANAALVLILDGGTSNQTTILDNGIGDSANTVTGTIVNTGINFGGLAVTVNTANSNSPGASSSGTLSITTLAVTNNNNSPVQLTVQTSDTNYTLPGGPLSLMNLRSSLSGTSSGASASDTVTFQSFVDPANAQPATAVSSPLQSLPITSSFNSTVNQSWTRGSGAYSLTNFLVINLGPLATANFTGITTTSVPEPTFGVVPALALGLLARRRKAAR